MTQTINEQIEKKILRESESKIEKLKPEYGWMSYAWETEEYKSSEIYKKKKVIVAFLKKIANEYNSGEEKDIYKQFWTMILELKLSPQFWMWVDHNLDKNIIFNSKFNPEEKLTSKFLWISIILGKNPKKEDGKVIDKVESGESKESKENVEVDTKN